MVAVSVCLGCDKHVLSLTKLNSLLALLDEAA